MAYNLSPYENLGSGITRSGAHKFPNPFFDIASEYVPTEMNQIFEYCEYIYLINGTYRSAARKVVRYFLTEIILAGESEDDREEIKEVMLKDMKIMDALAQIGDDMLVYGNVFISVFFPFDRYLACPQCGLELKIQKHKNYEFNSKELTFKSTCPKCKYEGVHKHKDRRSPDKRKVRLVRWNPKEIRMWFHPVSGQAKYFWELPTRFTDKLRSGDKFTLDTTPWAIIKCIGTSSANTDQRPLFEFKEDALLHLKESNLAGVPIIGWGIPPILPNFKLAYYIQVLRRYDEAIALDMIIPFRILYPTVGAQPQQDAVLSTNLSEFKSQMMRMIMERRRDPTSVQVAPFPIGYQMVGGEGKTLSPKDSIDFAVREMLNAMGYPAELYMGSLTLQAAPVALRLFENTWRPLVGGYDDVLAWVTRKLARHFMWGDVTASMRSVTLADDLERKALALQGAAGMDISKSTAYSPFGIRYLEEQQKILDEQKKINEMQTEAQSDAQAQQMQGNATQQQAGGSAPGDVNEQAKQIAQQLLYNTPETLRRGQLLEIKRSNPTLHALVIQGMNELRQQMQSQGQAQLMQQGQQAAMQGQQPPVAFPPPNPIQ